MEIESGVTSQANMCPILGANWERRTAVSCGQRGSDGVRVAVATHLTCGNVVEQGFCSPALSVRIEGVRGSNPLSSTRNCRSRADLSQDRSFWLRPVPRYGNPSY